MSTNQKKINLKQIFDETQMDGPSVSGALERALKSISLTDKNSGVHVGDGVRVIKCDADGTATTKIVSTQDFIDGKALAG